MGIKRSERSREITRRRHRRKKLAKIRAKLTKATGEKRAKLIAQARKISPGIAIE